MYGRVHNAGPRSNTYACQSSTNEMKYWTASTHSSALPSAVLRRPALGTRPQRRKPSRSQILRLAVLLA